MLSRVHWGKDRRLDLVYMWKYNTSDFSVSGCSFLDILWVSASSRPGFCFSNLLAGDYCLLTLRALSLHTGILLKWVMPLPLQRSAGQTTAWTLCPQSDFGASDLFLQSPGAFSGDDFSPTGVGQHRVHGKISTGHCTVAMTVCKALPQEGDRGDLPVTWTRKG